MFKIQNRTQGRYEQHQLMKMIFRVVVCLGLALINTILAQDALGDSGLKIDTIQAPPADCPRKAKKHDMLVLHYQGFFENGTKFDSRYVILLKLIQLFKNFDCFD